MLVAATIGAREMSYEIVTCGDWESVTFKTNTAL